MWGENRLSEIWKIDTEWTTVIRRKYRRKCWSKSETRLALTARETIPLLLIKVTNVKQ